jgi:hypothetical protein
MIWRQLDDVDSSLTAKEGAIVLKVPKIQFTIHET